MRGTVGFRPVTHVKSLENNWRPDIVNPISPCRESLSMAAYETLRTLARFTWESRRWASAR